MAATWVEQAWAGPALAVSAEVGPELDTNATRVAASTQGASPVQAGLMRVTASTAVRLRVARRHALMLDYGGGAKVFAGSAARAADELVQLAGAGWMVDLPWARLGVVGSYYDAFQRESTRDFRSGVASAQLSLDRLAPRLGASFNLGYRGLEYKPLPDYSFNGLAGGALLDWRLTSGRGEATVDWGLKLAYTAGLRYYQGPVMAVPARCASAQEAFPCTEDVLRQDLHHQARAEVAYAGSADASLWYSLEVNRSNSYGESFTRHAVGFKFTSVLVWGVFLSTKVLIQLSRFKDPYLTSQTESLSFLSVEDENRSSLALQLARDLGDRWAINLRYGLYVNESASRSDSSASIPLPLSGFLRQTLFLGVRFEYER